MIKKIHVSQCNIAAAPLLKTVEFFIASVIFVVYKAI